MRSGISITVTPADRCRLEAIASDRNAPQKHVWRSRIRPPSTASSPVTTRTRSPSHGPQTPTKSSPPSGEGTKRWILST